MKHLLLLLTLAVASPTIAGLGNCGALDLNPPIPDCYVDAPEFVVSQIIQGARILLDYAGPKPVDGFYAVSVEDEPGRYAGFYFSPTACDWRQVVGSKEEILEQIKAYEVGGPAHPTPQFFHWVEYEGEWSVKNKDCVTRKIVNCKGQRLSW